MRRGLRSKPSTLRAGRAGAPRGAVEARRAEGRARRRVVEGEQAEAAAQVQHAAAGRQVLPDLVEEALAQNPEAAPAVTPHDRVVVRADDATNRFASHRSGIPGPRAAARRRAPDTPGGAETARAGPSHTAGGGRTRVAPPVAPVRVGPAFLQDDDGGRAAGQEPVDELGAQRLGARVADV